MALQSPWQVDLEPFSVHTKLRAPSIPHVRRNWIWRPSDWPLARWITGQFNLKWATFPSWCRILRTCWMQTLEFDLACRPLRNILRRMRLGDFVLFGGLLKGPRSWTAVSSAQLPPWSRCNCRWPQRCTYLSRGNERPLTSARRSPSVRNDTPASGLERSCTGVATEYAKAANKLIETDWMHVISSWQGGWSGFRYLHPISPSSPMTYTCHFVLYETQSRHRTLLFEANLLLFGSGSISSECARGERPLFHQPSGWNRPEWIVDLDRWLVCSSQWSDR